LLQSRKLHPKQEFEMKVICLGNYPPRQCGIATFTENLVTAIMNAADIHSISIDIEVIAMNDCGKTYPYPPLVRNFIRSESMDDYIQMADYINNSGAVVVALQYRLRIGMPKNFLRMVGDTCSILEMITGWPKL